VRLISLTTIYQLNPELSVLTTLLQARYDWLRSAVSKGQISRYIMDNSMIVKSGNIMIQVRIIVNGLFWLRRKMRFTKRVFVLN